MVIENHTYFLLISVLGIQLLEECDKFTTAMTINNGTMNLSRQ